MESKFLDFSEILENRAGGSKEEKTGQKSEKETGPTASFRLKPDGYSAANGSPTGVELSHYLAVVSVGLKVQEVSGIEDSFSAQWQSEAWQFLSYLDAEGRIINGQTPGKRIDREHRRIRRETQNCSDVGPSVESGA